MLHLDRVSKTVWRGAHRLPLLQDVSLRVDGGEVVAVHAARRAGKTTLLSIAAGLMTPDAGTVRFEDVDVGRLADVEHARLLAERLGWVRCGDAAPRGMPAPPPVAVPRRPRHGRRAAERRAAEALALVGAERCAGATWDRLSDLERTLVALARALGRQPALLLVDDPTVGLRADECERVVGLLREQAETTGIGVLFTVPERVAARRAHRTRLLRDGRLAAPSTPPDDDDGRVIRLPLRR